MEVEKMVHPQTISPNETMENGDEQDPHMSEVGVAGGSEEEVATVVNEAVVNVAEKKRSKGRPRKYTSLSTIGSLPCLSSPPSFPPLSASSQETRRRKANGKLKVTPSVGRHCATDSAAEESFTPYVETVVAGEDIVSKMVLLSMKTGKAICVLSATGTVTGVLFRPPADPLIATLLPYQGICEILSLSGSCIYDPKRGNVPSVMKNCMLSVTLALPNGQVFGGSLAGLGSLIAAGPVQLIVASFNQNSTCGNGKQLKRKYYLAESSSADGTGSHFRVSQMTNIPLSIRGMDDKEYEDFKTPTSAVPPSAQLQTTADHYPVLFGNHNFINTDPLHTIAPIDPPLPQITLPPSADDERVPNM